MTATTKKLAKIHRDSKPANADYFAHAFGYAGSWHRTPEAAERTIRRYCNQTAKAINGPAPTGTVSKVAADWSLETVAVV